jgi:hypothetical protein
MWHLRIWASSLQFRASKINMALARMDKLVKKLMSNPVLGAQQKFSIQKEGIGMYN